MHRLPPLSAIQAFEAAARHLSFSRAAKELHVTSSAVSHRVRTLEQLLGVALFNRRTRQVTLTVEGEAYLAPVREALEQIGNATALMGRKKRRALIVSVAPAFAPRLIHSLKGFALAHPDVELQITPSIEVVDLAGGEADIAVRYGSGKWNEMRSHLLASEAPIPVCSPHWKRELRIPADLTHVPLLHIVPRPGEWRTWLARAGVDDVGAAAGMQFQNSILALEAAASGLGVAIVDRPLAADYLKRGRVVIPFAETLPSTNGYYLVYPSRRENEARLAALRDWILSRWRPAKNGVRATGAPQVASRSRGTTKSR